VTKVKICGITNLEDARHAASHGADMIGFNFYRASKRYISADVATRISLSIGETGPAKVGIFVNAEIAEIAEIVENTGLNMVQLHGEEDEAFMDELRNTIATGIIKAFRVSPRFAFEEAATTMARYVLLDTHAANEPGGTGQTFDWAIASEVAAERPNTLILAGGLTADNVAEAIRTVNPYAVDVASGVETRPGKKDPAKVEAFIRNAKNA